MKAPCQNISTAGHSTATSMWSGFRCSMHAARAGALNQLAQWARDIVSDCFQDFCQSTNLREILIFLHSNIYFRLHIVRLHHFMCFCLYFTNPA